MIERRRQSLATAKTLVERAKMQLELAQEAAERAQAVRQRSQARIDRSKAREDRLRAAVERARLNGRARQVGTEQRLPVPPDGGAAHGVRSNVQGGHARAVPGFEPSVLGGDRLPGVHNDNGTDD